MNSKNSMSGSKLQKQDQLKLGLERLHLSCNEKQINQLLNYLDLLERWNKAYNLTAIRDPFDMINLHLLDSLAISVELQGDRFIDVGTGPGLPGIPLAIMNQNKNFTLLDSNGKKTRFLFQTKLELGLDNISEVNQRVQDFHPKQTYDCVLSRAFSSLGDMVENCHHLLNQNGYFLAMKGKLPQTELRELPKNYKVEKLHSINVPGVEGQRHLIKIVKT
jgi:16S rRNA (guanine527-N7)-methyltransferase|tara:strand:- start:1386 stop:2042 length:657 start_codon:yes stop_codon:yes gene_type:complete